MNWEAIGAIGEIFGAIAVVVTLIYLSRQLNEHTKSLKVQSLNSSFSDYDSLVAEVQSLDGMGNAFRKVTVGEDLSSDEEYEIGWLFRRIMNAHDKVRYMHSIGAADSYNKDAFEKALPGLVGTKYFRIWWSEFRNRYSDDFQGYIEGHIDIHTRLEAES
jgi:hypothetical protein